ncbi:MAG TPA: hypothetical protein VFV08_14605, partial [Puia sp.]|nr:hypothetical protein [Puia sp.]
LIRYRILMGKLISIYELQAVPLWDVETIRQLRSYITVRLDESLVEKFKRRWKTGDRFFLMRLSQVLEKSKGFSESNDSSSSKYLGSLQRLFFRYTYNYKNLLQYGILGDKDAGEQFFRGKQKSGFDFYSYHFFLKSVGIIRAFALGDYTINIGQGLVQWQSIAFTKSAGVLAIKRQGPVLKPYHSAGEYNFHRGIAIDLQKRNWSGLAFFSGRRISTNQEPDSSGREDLISSFNNSGYHRTLSENANRNNTSEVSFGGNLNYRGSDWHIGFSGIHYQFSDKIQKQPLPYNLFALRGISWSNYSLDYSATLRNFHFFGEIACDKNSHLAFVNGVLMSLASVVDAAILYRHIDRQYHSIYSDAFTESTEPNNEKGIYGAISIRPQGGWKLDAFFDLFRFPWLRYRVDAPSFGRDCFVQAYFQNSKSWNLYTRFRWEAKQGNNPDSDIYTHPLLMIQKQSWRTELMVSLIKNVLLAKTRIECSWYRPGQAASQQGFLSSFDILYHSFKQPYSGNIRFQYFESGGYESRIYAFERDLEYSFSMPSYYNKGFRYYINMNLRFIRKYRIYIKKMKWDASVRWSQTIYSGETLIGSALDAIKGNKRSEIKFQFVCSW